MKNLSKSKYTTYCQCPKALWLKIHKPEEQVIDPSVQARFEAGSEVGELAKRLFGEFEDVTTYVPMDDGSQCLDLKAMIAKTQDCLNRNASNPQPPSKNDIELKEKEATQKKRLKEVKIATRRHKIPLPHNAT